jgi:hypothetical protein
MPDIYGITTRKKRKAGPNRLLSIISIVVLKGEVVVG